jgi:CheY-like chemotaxis protein
MERDKRVLVVDDDEPIRMLLLRILRRRGFAVDTARNGAEAIDAMKRCRYAVALIDLMMPVQSGWDVLDWMETLPVGDRPMAVVLTAGMTVRKLNPRVVAGTMRKPFDVELLLDMVTGCATAYDVVQSTECPPAESASLGETIPPRNLN